MDRWGAEGCRKRKREIVEHLLDQYRRLSWPVFAAALPRASIWAWKGLRQEGWLAHPVRNALSAMVDEAIRMAHPGFTTEEVTVVVTTFLRYDCLRRLLFSLSAYYPELPVIVVDQSGDQNRRGSYEWCRSHPQIAGWIDLPYDTGLAECRNAGVQAVPGRLLWLLDDDFIISRETDLQAAIDVLNAESDAALVAGMLREQSRVQHWCADIAVSGNSVTATPLAAQYEYTDSGVPYKRSDRYLNFFVARKDLLLPWNPAYKIRGEHRMHVAAMKQAGRHCYFTPRLVALHDRTTESTEYEGLRRRKQFSDVTHREWHGTWEPILEPVVPVLKELPAGENIVVLTPGHTGSRLIVALLAAMGWHVPDDDGHYREPRCVVAENERHLRKRMPTDQAGLKDMVKTWPQPWVIKDPRFCLTLWQWLPALAPCRPLLLVSQRDQQAVERSWLRRGEPLSVLRKRQEAMQRLIRYWPWRVATVRLEKILEAIAETRRADG